MDKTERALTSAYNDAVRKLRRNTDPLKEVRLAEKVAVALRRLRAYQHTQGR